MTLISLKAGAQNDPDLLKIEFSDGSSLVLKKLYLNYCKPFSLNKLEDGSSDIFHSYTEGMEISPEEEEAFRFSAACYRAERAGTRLIARAEQTSAGLSRKLQARGHDPTCVSAVVAWFVDADLINDERYAERWLRSRLSRKAGKIPGPRRLSAALGNRGIGRDALREAFDKTLDEDTEFALLQRFVAKNRSGAVIGAYSLRSKLRYEGFSSPVINRYFAEAIDKALLF